MDVCVRATTANDMTGVDACGNGAAAVTSTSTDVGSISNTHIAGCAD